MVEIDADIRMAGLAIQVHLVLQRITHRWNEALLYPPEGAQQDKLIKLNLP
jgi:hypothetical protein